MSILGIVSLAVSACSNSTSTTGHPRNKTLVLSIQPVVTDNNWNPIGPSTNPPQRKTYGIFEELFYTNLNTGKLIPWQAQSYAMNTDFTQVTVKLRQGVKWSDGQAFTADDVKFTIDTVKAGAPDLYWSSNYQEYVKDVVVIDSLTVQINLQKPSPRWFANNFTLGTEPHYTIVPKHIFEGKDPKTFTFYDPAKGWPLGTGPYHLTSSTANQIVLDRNAHWWGTDTGFSKAPAPDRIIFIPLVDQTACSNLYISNQVDGCTDLAPGLLVATMAKNHDVRSWSPHGPVWGAPDGYLFTFQFNTTRPPFNDANVRLAINYAINRQQIVDLGLEGNSRPAVIPFSSYMSAQWQPGRVQALIDKYDRGSASQAKVDEYMGKAGYTKNSQGMWAKGGNVLKLDFIAPDWLAPLPPVLQQQFIKAGFDATGKIDAKYDAQVNPGTVGAWALVQGASVSDPYDTYSQYDPKWAVPNGTSCTQFAACTRWNNASIGSVLAQMGGMLPDSSQNSKYMDLVVQATDLYLQNMPDIIIGEELHPLTYNQHYWTGWPTQEDPYVAPFYCCYGSDITNLFHLKPTNAS